MNAPDWMVEHKALGERVVAAVGLPRARGVDLFFVGSAVSGAIAHARQIAAGGRVHAPRRDDAHAIAVAARALTESVNRYSESWPDPDGTAHVLAVTRRQLLSALKIAEVEYGDRAERANIAAKHSVGFSDFVREGLAPVFKACFGQAADVKYCSYATPEYSGAFLPFARFVFAEAGVEITDSAIHQALRRKKGQNPK